MMRHFTDYRNRQKVCELAEEKNKTDFKLVCPTQVYTRNTCVLPPSKLCEISEFVSS